MPAQRLYLRSDQPLAHDIANVLIEREMNKDIRTFYQKHHDIGSQAMNDVDWQAAKLGLNTAREVSYRKTLHKLRNTMSINKKWKRTECDLCPLCSNAPETIMHMFSCSHEDISYVRRTRISRMFASLDRLNTQADILNHWKKLFQNIESNEKFTQPPLSMLNPVS